MPFLQSFLERPKSTSIVEPRGETSHFPQHVRGIVLARLIHRWLINRNWLFDTCNLFLKFVHLIEDETSNAPLIPKESVEIPGNHEVPRIGWLQKPLETRPLKGICGDARIYEIANDCPVVWRSKLPAFTKLVRDGDLVLARLRPGAYAGVNGSANYLRCFGVVFVWHRWKAPPNDPGCIPFGVPQDCRAEWNVLASPPCPYYWTFDRRK